MSENEDNKTLSIPIKLRKIADLIEESYPDGCMIIDPASLEMSPYCYERDGVPGVEFRVIGAVDDDWQNPWFSFEEFMEETFQAFWGGGDDRSREAECLESFADAIMETVKSIRSEIGTP